MSAPDLVIYGATGYTGRMIVQRAVDRGLRPVIAGRNEDAIKSMAASCGLEWKLAHVSEPDSLHRLTAGAKVLINAAGPFAATAGPLIDACIATGTHYLDITGDSATIEPTAQWHDRAVLNKVMLMPAAGFDVVASDCLLAHVARRLPGANSLKLGFDKSEPMSTGSLKTILEMSGQGVRVRRNGRLISVAPGSLVHDFDYGRGPQPSFAVNLGDTSSAFFSTGIGNIETYMRASVQVWSAITASQYWGWLLATPPWQATLKAQMKLFARDPSLLQSSAAWGTLVAEAKDSSGQSVRSRLHTGDVYWFTALSAVAVAEKCIAGEWQAGFQTPSRVYGPDFVLSIDSARRIDFG
ncbi:MAG: saccharopine dehydrogenase NADP-binding domain-containing protein [Terracidiphilus sp.]